MAVPSIMDMNGSFLLAGFDSRLSASPPIAVVISDK